MRFAAVLFAICALQDGGNSHWAPLQAKSISVRLLPQCLPPPPPVDVYGFYVEVVQVLGDGLVALNGKAIPKTQLIGSLPNIYGADTRQILYVSFEGGEYADLMNVLNLTRSLHASVVLLTPKSRVEFQRELLRTDCRFQFH